MSFVRNLAIAGTLVAGGAGAGVVASAAPGPAVASPGSDLSTDIHAGETGEHGSANDVETAQESDVNNGAVENVDVQENETGDQQTGSANDRSDLAGNKADVAGDTHASAGADGQAGESGAQGSSNQ